MTAPSSDKGAASNRGMEWLKFVLTGSAMVAFLVAYGFLSETAAFQYLGLPQLQSDPVEMAEQGGRNLIDSFGALGLGRAGALLAAILTIVFLWWARVRSPYLHRISMRVSTVMIAQIAILLSLFLTLASLVELRVVTSAGLTPVLDQRVAALRAEQRLRPNWDPRQELARTEALDFEVGPVRRACRVFENWVPDDFRWWSADDSSLRAWWFDLHCFTARDYEWHPNRRASPHLADTANDAGGINKRRTAEARAAARKAFGSLFAGLLALVVAVYLVLGWRRWVEQHASGASLHINGVVEGQHHGFHSASTRVVEPLMLILLVLCVGLLPSAYGVLGSGKVGMQDVMVRLKNQASVNGVPCTGIASATGRRSPSDDWLPLTAEGAAGTMIIDRARPETLQPESDWEALTCNATELERLSGRPANMRQGDPGDDGLIGRYHEAWTTLMQTRSSDQEGVEPALKELRRRTDELIAAVGSMRCPEAFARLWQALPREPEFTSQPVAAQYVWERWTELQRTRSMVRFGTLVSYPRGANRGQLLLADLLRRPDADRPIEVALQPVPLACAESVEPISNLQRAAVADAVRQIIANPIDEAPIKKLAQSPGESSLKAMLLIHRQRIVPKQFQGFLVTQIGTQAGRLRESNPLLHAEAVDSLASAVDKGLCIFNRRNSLRAGNSVDLDGPSSACRDAEESDWPLFAEEAGSAATSLHLAGGPYAAVRLAKIVCDHLLSGGRQDCLAAVRASTATTSPLDVDASLSNRIGTSVTAAGFLISDASSAMRALSAIGPTDCASDAAIEASYCDSSAILNAQVMLEVYLNAVAGNATPDPDGVSHRIDIRRAACTGLGLAGTKGAAMHLQSLVPSLIATQNGPLLGACLVHLPTIMADSVRNQLRAIAGGEWPDAAQGRKLGSPPASLRRLALGELLEASVFFEDELIAQLLHDADPLLRVEAAKVIEDVEPFAMAGRLTKCAQLAGEAASSTVDADPTSETRRLRCLRALPLLGEGYDGDDGLARSLIGTLGNDQPAERERLRETVCRALREFEARNGRDAIEVLQGTQGSDEPTGTCPTGEMKGLDARARWREHLARFAAAEGVKDLLPEARALTPVPPIGLGGSSQPADDDAMLAEQVERALGGDSTAVQAILGRFESSSGDERERSYVALSLIGFDRAAAYAVPLLLEMVPTVLTYRSAQFIEDGDQQVLDRALTACLGNETEHEDPIRARCAIGLALTATEHVPTPAARAALEEALSVHGLTTPACHALAEFSRRDASTPPEACRTIAATLRDEPMLRWQQHLNVLLDALIAQRRATGPYPGESDADHTRILERLGGAKEEIDQLLALSAT